MRGNRLRGNDKGMCLNIEPSNIIVIYNFLKSEMRSLFEFCHCHFHFVLAIY